MIGLVRLLVRFVLAPFKSRQRSDAENAALCRPLVILARHAPKRPHPTDADRLIFIRLYRLFPSIRGALLVFNPETVPRQRRLGSQDFQRRDSRSCGGRPRVSAEFRALTRGMSQADAPWGAPRWHGELLELGIHLAQSAMAKSMVRRRGPPFPELGNRPARSYSADRGDRPRRGANAHFAVRDIERPAEPVRRIGFSPLHACLRRGR